LSENFLQQFWNELKRRNVFQAVISYAITAWLLMQIGAIVFPSFGAPAWVMKSLIVLLVLGFPIATVLAWYYELTSQGLKANAEMSSAEARLAKRKFSHLLTLVLGMAVVFLLVERFVIDHAPTAQPGSASSVISSDKSIAVLPFKNLSGTDDNLYFSDGVMEAILNNLSLIGDLRVVSRTSVESYRDTDKRAPEIGRELNVAHILEGSVQRVGSRLRITAQLIATDSDSHLWSARYDRTIDDIFEIQSEIARAITDNLELILTSELKAELANAPTSNLRAYDLYLRARHLPNLTADDNRNAIELCEQALELDPKFAHAYAEIARNQLRLGVNDFISEQVWRERTLAYVDRALSLRPNLWEAYAVKAELYATLGDNEKAVRYAEKVLLHNPNNTYFLLVAGTNKIRLGNLGDGLDLVLKSLSLIPEHIVDERTGDIAYSIIFYDWQLLKAFVQRLYREKPELKSLLYWIYIVALYDKDYDAYLSASQALVEWSPTPNNIINLGLAYLFHGDFRKSRETYEKVLAMNADASDNFLKYPFLHRYAYTLMQTGERERGLEMLDTYRDRLLAATGEGRLLHANQGSYYDLAVIYAVLDDPQNSLHWLQQAQDHVNRGAFMPLDFLLGDTMLDSLRAEPAFQAILRQKLERQETLTRLFRHRLERYQARGQLLWLRGD